MKKRRRFEYTVYPPNYKPDFTGKITYKNYNRITKAMKHAKALGAGAEIVRWIYLLWNDGKKHKTDWYSSECLDVFVMR